MSSNDTRFKKGMIPWNKGKKGLMPTPWNKGIPMSDETKKKISIAKTGSVNHLKGKKMPSDWVNNLKGPRMSFREDNNPHWKGDDVGYSSLHKWVKKHLGNPNKCERCGFESDNNRKIHWANVSGNYYRNFEDWIRLCVKCHKEYDKERQNNIHIRFPELMKGIN